MTVFEKKLAFLCNKNVSFFILSLIIDLLGQIDKGWAKKIHTKSIVLKLLNMNEKRIK